LNFCELSLYKISKDVAQLLLLLLLLGIGAVCVLAECRCFSEVGACTTPNYIMSEAAAQLFQQVTMHGVEPFLAYINSGGDVTLRDGNPPGLTLLHYLVGVPVQKYSGSETQMMQALQLALAKGARVDALSDTGDTPLHLVTTIAMARVLLDHGGKVNCVEHSGSSPLHFAAQSSHTEVLQLLLQRGGDCTLQNAAGIDAFSQRDESWPRRCVP
jgi:Ankyrin repeats (3 copies)